MLVGCNEHIGDIFIFSTVEKQCEMVFKNSQVAGDLEKRQQAPADCLCAWVGTCCSYYPCPSPLLLLGWGCSGSQEKSKKSQSTAAKWWREPPTSPKLPSPAQRNQENQERTETLPTHYHYCGHLCMVSKGEINKNDHVAGKYPPQLIKNETLK